MRLPDSAFSSHHALFHPLQLPFLDIISLQHGLKVFDTLGGPAAIEAHVDSLGRYLAAQAARLRHSNGAPLLQIYGAHGRADRCAGRCWAGGAWRRG